MTSLGLRNLFLKEELFQETQQRRLALNIEHQTKEKLFDFHFLFNISSISIALQKRLKLTFLNLTNCGKFLFCIICPLILAAPCLLQLLVFSFFFHFPHNVRVSTVSWRTTVSLTTRWMVFLEFPCVGYLSCLS